MARPKCMLHLLAQAAEGGSRESTYKAQRTVTTKENLNGNNTSHPNSNSTEQLIDITVGVSHR